MPNTPVPAAATGLPTANIIPFPARPPAQDEFEPITIAPGSLALTDTELRLLDTAGFVLGLQDTELKRRLRSCDPQAHECFASMLVTWEDLTARIAALSYILDAARQRVAPLLQGSARHG